MDNFLTYGQAVKIVSDTITLDWLVKKENENEKNKKKGYEASKKKIQRLSKISLTNLSGTDYENYRNFVNQTNSWSDWAVNHKYIEPFQRSFMNEFFDMLIYAADCFMPLDRNTFLHFLCFSLSKVIHITLYHYHEINYQYNYGQIMFYGLTFFDVFGIDEQYLKKVTPIQGALELICDWTENLNDVIEFWENKISSEHKNEEPINLKLYFMRWMNGTKPSARYIQLLLDTDLTLPAEYFKKIKGFKSEDFYRAFKTKLLFAFLITNLFDSLESQKLISKEDRNMIWEGTRMYYRDVYVVRQKSRYPAFEKGAKENLMFRTLFNMLEGDLSKCDLIDFLLLIQRDPNKPYLSD